MVDKQTRGWWRDDAHHWIKRDKERPAGQCSQAFWDVENVGVARRVLALLDDLDKPWWRRLFRN